MHPEADKLRVVPANLRIAWNPANLVLVADEIAGVLGTVPTILDGAAHPFFLGH